MSYIYAIKDEVSGIFYDPLISDSDAACRRDFEYSLQHLEEDTPVRLYPRDFAVYRLGAYDFRTGKVSGADLERVFCISDLIKEASSDAD